MIRQFLGTIAVAGLFALSSVAHADMNGTWVGKFSYTSSSGDAGTMSDETQLQITYADSTLQLSLTSSLMDVDASGVVTIKGDVVGQLSDQSLTLDLVDQISGNLWHLALKLNADSTLSYEDQYTFPSGDWDKYTATFVKQ